MSEEIVDLIDEVIDAPETVEETPIVEDIEEEDGEFNPDEEGFDEDEYSYEGYDLSNFKDRLDFSTEENVGIITSYLSGLQDKGFTQEQIEFLLEKELSEIEKEEEKPIKKGKTKAEIREGLKQSLTQEERRNYKAVNAFVADMLDGSELSEFKNEIMSNPNLVKLMNVMYTKSLGKTGNINRTVSKKSEKPMTKMLSYEEAYAQVVNEITKKGNPKDVASKLSKSVSDKEKFSQMMKAMGLL